MRDEEWEAGEDVDDVEVSEVWQPSKRRWVQRNEDKPHRCPECHAVATWDKERYGPRTKLHCPNQCRVQWRTKNRQPRPRMRFSGKNSGPWPLWWRLDLKSRRLR